MRTSDLGRGARIKSAVAPADFTASGEVLFVFLRWCEPPLKNLENE